MIVDANILLYAVDSTSTRHDRAAEWWTDALNGDVTVGLPWQTIGAFLRISTHPRIFRDPLDGPAAWSYIAGWLEAPPVWIPPATEATARVYGHLVERTAVTGNLVPDALLAAHAIEHGVELISADSDFSRFPGLRHRDPLTE